MLIYAQDNDYGKSEKTEIEVEINIPAKSTTAQIIDNNHCNPKSEWETLGSPDILTKSQVEEIKAKTQGRDYTSALIFYFIGRAYHSLILGYSSAHFEYFSP